MKFLLLIFISLLLTAAFGYSAKDNNEGKGKLGRNECSWGPTHYCSTDELKKKCDTFEVCKELEKRAEKNRQDQRKSPEMSNSYRYNISSHVLDSNKGLPVPDLSITLYKLESSDKWIEISKGKTASTGRVPEFTSEHVKFTASTYKLHFDVKEYYDRLNQKTLYPAIDITFQVDDANQHYHIPLLLNAYGYTTYRGS